jgi:hypothetical protein
MAVYITSIPPKHLTDVVLPTVMLLADGRTRWSSVLPNACGVDWTSLSMNYFGVFSKNLITNLTTPFFLPSSSRRFGQTIPRMIRIRFSINRHFSSAGIVYRWWRNGTHSPMFLWVEQRTYTEKRRNIEKKVLKYTSGLLMLDWTATLPLVVVHSD